MENAEDDAKLKKRAYKICQEFLGGVWEKLSFKDFRFSVVRGGLSNKLHHCALPENFESGQDNDDNKVPREALMRIYGPVQDEQESRLQEIAIFILLSERNLGPKLYGLFSDGRLEEYIPSKPLNWDTVCTYSTSIAKEMAKIHAVQLPIRKKPIFPIQTYEWLEFVKDNSDPKTMKPLYNIFFTDEFRKEVTWVINRIEKMDSPVVFCNNDLQGGNILLMARPKHDGKNLMLIDFEFGAYNYRFNTRWSTKRNRSFTLFKRVNSSSSSEITISPVKGLLMAFPKSLGNLFRLLFCYLPAFSSWGFDIANHFNERCFDYSTTDSSYYCSIDATRYPSEFEQIEFIDAYINQLQKEGILFKNGAQAEKDKLLEEIPLLRLAVLLYWIGGSCKFDLLSTIHFPYLELANASWEMYKTNKQKLLSKNSEQQ